MDDIKKVCITLIIAIPVLVAVIGTIGLLGY
jgi:hypothetical protein